MMEIEKLLNELEIRFGNIGDVMTEICCESIDSCDKCTSQTWGDDRCSECKGSQWG
jgi:hypothetical protein